MIPYTPLSMVIPQEIWPEGLFDSDGSSFLDSLACVAFDERAEEDGFTMFMRAKVMAEARIGLPFLQGISLVLGAGDSAETGLIDVDVSATFFPDSPPTLELIISTTVLSLSIDAQVLHPVALVEDQGKLTVVHKEGSLSIPLPFVVQMRYENEDWTFDFQTPADQEISLDIPTCRVGESSVVLEAHQVSLNFSGSGSRPSEAPEGWRGLYLGQAKLFLPDIFSGYFEAKGFGIGTGGLYGNLRTTFSLSYDLSSSTFSGDLVTSVLGLTGGISSVSLGFVQNVPSEIAIQGKIMLPFFDRVVDLAIGFDIEGNLTATLGSTSGLASVDIENVLHFDLISIGIEIHDGQVYVGVSGKAKPLFGEGLQWPSFDIKKLTIDSSGNVHLDGGWLDLPNQYSFDFYGFKMEITKLGFGKTDDGGKWIGFSGSLKLVEGLTAGGSVEGLRIIWYGGGSTSMTLNGVGVEFEVPNALYFKGVVAYKGGRFEGAIKVELTSLNVEMDGTLVIGSESGNTYFAIYLDAELPAGIPLWSTGLALYGMAGLFALDMEPNKQPDEEWYGIGDSGWYHRKPVGATDVKGKWAFQSGSFALGAGVTIGTVSDNGYAFSGRMLLVIVFPGPVLLIEGKANILSKRASLDREPLFRALAVLDERAGTFLIGVDAQYKSASKSELIGIHASAEAFFSLSDASAWHLYLGLKDPREKRIRAEVFRLFEAGAYFMLDAHQLALGAWVGYKKHWSFGPLGVTAEAWIEGNALISWNPMHLHGDLWLHGKAALKVFWFSLGLSVDAGISADVFHPFDVLAQLKVGIDLPWPLPDFSVNIPLEWKDPPVPPPLPLLLKEIAVEHLKVTTSWPLPRGQLLLPNYDTNDDGYYDTKDDESLKDPVPTVAEQETSDPPADVPVVPLDARPHLTFTHSIWDDVLVGGTAQPLNPEWEQIGDPTKNEGQVQIRYGLKEVTLAKRVDGARWETVASRIATLSQDPDPKASPQNWQVTSTGALFGSWAPVPAVPDGDAQSVGQVKLLLWSQTPFDYTRHSSRAWNEWFTKRFNAYPCIQAAPDRTVCCDFERMAPGDELKEEWSCTQSTGIAGEESILALQWNPPIVPKVTVLDQTVMGFRRALCFPATVADTSTGGANKQVWISLSQPASSVRILLAEDSAEDRVCVDFSALVAGSGPNPRSEHDVVFGVYDDADTLLSTASIDVQGTTAGKLSGLNCGFTLKIELPTPSSSVDLTLTHFAELAIVEAFNADGGLVAEARMRHQQGDPETLNLTGSSIRIVSIQAPMNKTLLHEFCFGGSISQVARVEATGSNARADTYGPVPALNNIIEVKGEDLTQICIEGTDPFCVVQICATIGPDPREVAQREEWAQHLIDATASWNYEGYVLEPHTIYRLKVVTSIQRREDNQGKNYQYDQDNDNKTEFVYFRTEGPPGLAQLSVPLSSSNNQSEFNSGLNDLVPYVRQTIPASVPAAGENPPLPRPIYRAYDVGVEFNEDYVEQMYRMERRDLGLYLYNNNNQPVRDVQGRLIVLTNRWGKAEEVTLDESEKRWVLIVNASDCIPQVDIRDIPPDDTLTSCQILDPDTVYEARLVPLLLHEDFSYTADTGATSADGPNGTLRRWSILDEGQTEGPSHWEIRKDQKGAYSIVQTSNVCGGTQDGNDPVKPGTLLLFADNPTLPDNHPEQPGNWTNFRMNVIVHPTESGAIGIVFRYKDSGNYYRFSLDRKCKYRRLVRVINNIHTILAEDDFVYQLNCDYLFTVETIDSSLRVYQDGAIVFTVEDTSQKAGRIGLYCWGSAGAQFSDVCVDDFRHGALAAYRFQFTTSQFSNFFHYMHSYQDETWPEVCPIGTTLASVLEKAAPLLPAPPDLSAPPADLSEPSEEETRTYDDLVTQVLGSSAPQTPPEIQVTRVEQGEGKEKRVLALLVQGPEPIDWKRTAFGFWNASLRVALPELPGIVKLTDVSFGTAHPNEESVTLLLRQSADLTGMRIEQRCLPGPLAVPTDTTPLLAETFSEAYSGLLFREEFGPNALDHYTIVGEGIGPEQAHWAVSDSEIVQTSAIDGGTVALTGSVDWTDIQVNTILYPPFNAEIGLTFRYLDENNYYRFSIEHRLISGEFTPPINIYYRRLTKKAQGQVNVLWQDTPTYSGKSNHLEINVCRDQLVGYLDEGLLFCLHDREISAGKVGFYCFHNPNAHFSSLEVKAISAPFVLWQPPFAGLDEVEVVNEEGTNAGPSHWETQDGGLLQSSIINGEDGTPFKPGTYALGGSTSWRDIQISVGLRPTVAGDIGVMFRYQNQDNYYRFSMGLQDTPSQSAPMGYRRLIKKVGGAITVLWQDDVPYVEARRYELTLRLVGNELSGVLDGVPLFTVYDSDVKLGQVGFYCWRNSGAFFDRVVVTDRTRCIGRWTIHDEGAAGVPSVWKLSNGRLVQIASINGGSAPASPGTYAVACEDIWDDYRLVVRLRSDDAHAIGVLFRYRDDDNYYRLSLDAQNNYRRLVKKDQGLFTTLWEDSQSYNPGDDFTLIVDAIGSRLVGYLDAECLFDVVDRVQTIHTTGQVGLYCWGNNGARFERVEVLPPPLEALALLRDQFGKGDISDWNMINEGTIDGPSHWAPFEGTIQQTSNINLPPDDRETLGKQGTQAVAGDKSWSDVVISVRVQSCDDDAIGLLFRYKDAQNYYRFSMDSRRHYQRLVKNVGGTFTLLWERAVSYEVGRVYELTVIAIRDTLRGFLDGIPLFAVEDSELEEGQIGLYCWANQDARFSQVRVYPANLAYNGWVLDEPFTVMVRDRWGFVEEGDRGKPMQWGVTDGELRQSSGISSDDSGPAKLGTYAYTGDITWTDYRTSVRLLSDSVGALGVMFRYQNQDNYYRFSMGSSSLPPSPFHRPAGYRRLIKKVNGVVSVLWEDAMPYVKGQEYLVTLDCVGEQLSGYLDGKALFEVVDRDLTAGGIGLYCYANPGARFQEVRVSPPVWMPYYTFGQEERLPDGTRVTVYAGNEVEAPPAEPGVIKRFKAPLDESGRLALEAKGATLRLRAPGKTDGHQRIFLPEGKYSPTSARVLRKADGTGFFLFLPSTSSEGSLFPPAQYRLEMTYYRDIQSVDPASQVFSEAGDAKPEQVRLNISLVDEIQT